MFKRLQTSSETFPQLSYKCILDWVKQIGIVNDVYHATEFTKIYEELKVPEKKMVGQKRKRNNSIVSRSSMKLSKSATANSLSLNRSLKR